MAFYCPDCHRKVEAPSDTAEKLTCPGCNHTFDVPDGHRKGVLPPGTRIGGFEVVRLVGVGGMGQVYEARQLSLARRVALKIFSRKFASSEKTVERFLLEVRAAASLEHQNIVSIYEAAMEGDLLFLAMAYVDGPSVDKIIEATKAPIPEDKALNYVRKVAEAMEYAWRRQKLVHRDIKPANMLVDSLGDVKLCDLGIAKRGQDEHDITQAGMAIGTPHYISPEQGQGLTDIDFRADIYSLGASLFHMVTGTLPFEGDHATIVITKQILEPLPDPRSRNPQVSGPTVKLIGLMMEKLREDRHPSWGDLIIDLDRVAEGKDPAFRPSPRTPETSEVGPVPLAGTDTQSSRAPGGHGPASRRTADTLLRIAALLLVLLMTIGVVARLARPASGDRATQALVPDDGAPLRLATAPPPPEEIAGWLDPLARLPDAAPATSGPAAAVKHAIRAARQQGRSPVDRARQALAEGQVALFEDVLWYCVREYHGPDARWALEAAAELAAYYGETRQTQKFSDVLTQMLDFGRLGHARAAAEAAVLLAEFHELAGRYAEAEALLTAGLTRYEDDCPALADLLAVRYAQFLRARRDYLKLGLFLVHLRETYPQNTDAYVLAGNLQRDLSAELDQAATAPAAAPADRLRRAAAATKTMLAEMDQTQDEATKARIMLRIAAFFKQERLDAQYVETLEIVERTYRHLDGGAIAGQALLELAGYYQERNQMDAWQRTLALLLERQDFGTDGTQGRQAAEALADYWERQRNPALRGVYLRLIVDRFPGPRGTYAGAAALELARQEEADKRLFLARGWLLQIVKEFPGPADQHRRQAEAELARLERDYPGEVPKTTPAQARADGPFPDTIRFDGATRRYLEFTQRLEVLDQATQLTVECWFRQDEPAPDSQVLLSQHGGNERGFSLLVRGRRVIFQFGDGRQDRVLTGPETDVTKWHHVAAVVGKEAAELYLDGKRADRLPKAPVLNEGAAHLRVGRFGRAEAGYYLGRCQHVLVFARSLYDQDFTPEPKLHHEREAIVALTADADGVRDLAGNKFEFRDR